MSEIERFLIIGQLALGPIYLAGLYLAGFLVHDPHAWKAALAALGLTFLSYFFQHIGLYKTWARTIGGLVGVASIAVGAAGGIALLFD